MSPTLRDLTRQLRELHDAWSHPDAGGEYVSLVTGQRGTDDDWVVFIGGHKEGAGLEFVPGDGARFDAVAAARRLLAAAKGAL